MSELDTFIRFATEMGRQGLRSITISEEMYRRLEQQSQQRSLSVEPRLSRSMTIAGVDIIVDQADELMRMDILREQQATYAAVKRQALADGMIETSPGHFVRHNAVE